MSLKAPGALLLLVTLGGCTQVSDEALYPPIDDVPPYLVSLQPPADWIQVPLVITFRLKFSEPIDPTSVFVGTLHLLSPDVLIDARTGVSQTQDELGLVELTPRQPLLPGVEYTLRATRDITDGYGNGLDEEVVASYRTMR